jgi:outer membrane protein assembly factor BamE (lipoprotein component of BamABCDE complex)
MSLIKSVCTSVRVLRAPAALAAVLALSACGAYNSYVPGFITPYRSDVQQGNWVTSEMVALLKPGMTREQVRFALGSPALADIFHADRWDYPYMFKPGRGEPEQRLLTVFFESDRLARWQGDEMPDRQPFQKAPPPRAVNVPLANPGQRPPVTTPAAVGSGVPLPGQTTPEAGPAPERPRATINRDTQPMTDPMDPSTVPTPRLIRE